MKKVILIGCGKSKRKEKSKAEDLYTGSYFGKNLQLAKKISNEDDNIYILSAKFGVLELDDTINPYDITLNDKSEKERKLWSYKVVKQLERKGIKKDDLIIMLLGNNYSKYLKKYYKNHQEPLKGYKMGEKMREINKILKSEEK